MREYKKYNVYSPALRTQPVSAAKRNKPKLIFLALGFCLFLIFTGNSVMRSKAMAHDAAAMVELERKKSEAKKLFAQLVNDTITQNPEIDFSVAVIDIQDGQSQNFGRSQPLDAASTGKLITAITYLHEVETNKRSLGRKVDGLQAEYLIRQMINQSNDSAWQSLNNNLGHNSLESFAKDNGLASYDADKNMISTFDLAKLLQKLYSHKLLNASHTNLLLSYMQNTNYENFISPVIPADVRLYHKVGLNDDYVNEAAIISRGQSAYALVIYTNGKGVYDWSERADLIQKITKASLDAYLN